MYFYIFYPSEYLDDHNLVAKFEEEYLLRYEFNFDLNGLLMETAQIYKPLIKDLKKDNRISQKK